MTRIPLLEFQSKVLYIVTYGQLILEETLADHSQAFWKDLFPTLEGNGRGEWF